MRGVKEMKIIFNVDDFGISLGVVYGILEFYKWGVVKFIMFFVNSLVFDLVVEVVKENLGFDIGVYLILMFGFLVF